MASLRQADVRDAFVLIADAFAAGSTAEFVACVLPGLRALVGGEVASYAESDASGRPGGWVFDPGGEPFPGAGDLFTACFPEHPFSEQLSNPLVRTLRLSDMITLPKLRRQAFYDTVFRPLGAERQLATTLLVAAPRPLGIGLGFTRVRPDFTERERALLDLVNPHLARAYTTVVERAALLTASLAVEAALAAAGRAVVVVGPRGVVLSATDAARQLLGRYFAPELGDGLPTEMVEWIGDRRRGAGPGTAPGELAVERPDSRLVVRLVPRGDGTEGDLLTLEEQRDPLTPERLRRAGLTAREAEIVRLIAARRKNAEIATALSISRRTVDKHVEHILEKLGAADRTEAVATLVAG